jgi:hypothetical protein
MGSGLFPEIAMGNRQGGNFCDLYVSSRSTIVISSQDIDAIAVSWRMPSI